MGKNMKATIFETSRENGPFMKLLEEEKFSPITPEEESKGYPHWTVLVDPLAEFQTLEGLGGAMTEATCWTLCQMPEAMRHQILKEYFAPEGGCGYDMIRLHMNSCDFSLETYSCCDTPGDVELKTFNIERDKKWVVPCVKEALRLHPGLKILISPWSAPAWMKDNNDMCNGGKLLPQYYGVWAEFFCKYIEALAEEGIQVWGTTINNEPNYAAPWEAMSVSGEEERRFIRDNLGPALVKHGLGHVKIIAWDHCRDFIYHRISTICRDSAAARYVWGAGFHWYGQNCYDNLRVVHDVFPDVKLIMTEGCNGGNNYIDPEWGNADVKDPNGLFIHRNIWEGGERYARNMIRDLNNYACGWLDWNMVVDQTGGPRHLPNGCSAPFVYDTATGVLEPQVCLPFLQHFYRFLKVGMVRVAAVSPVNKLFVTAFKSPENNKVVLIAMNEENRVLDFGIVMNGQELPASMPPRSIRTWIIG